MIQYDARLNEQSRSSGRGSLTHADETGKCLCKNPQRNIFQQELNSKAGSEKTPLDLCLSESL